MVINFKTLSIHLDPNIPSGYHRNITESGNGVGTKSTLTDSQIRALKPQGRRYKVGDIRGLHLLVAPSGTKTWRIRWKDGGQEKTCPASAPMGQIGVIEERRISCSS